MTTSPLRANLHHPMRKLIKQYLPDRENLRQYKIFHLLGDSLLHPNLWHLNRHSAARGLAIGLVCGLIPGPLQMLGSALICLAWHANLPLALLTTLYTNPLTIVPLYLVAYTIGAWLLGDTTPFAPPPEMGDLGLLDWMHALMGWVGSLGKPLLLGLPTMALIIATLGYFACHLLWRRHVLHQWHKRCQRSALKS